MTICSLASLIDRLEAQRMTQRRELERSLTVAQRSGRGDLNDAERRAIDDLKELDRHIENLKADAERAGVVRGLAAREGQAVATRAFAQQAVNQLRGESRSVVAGSWDVPALVLPQVSAMQRPARLLDLLINRVVTDSTALEYFVQNLRETNATAVPDHGKKPVSRYQVTPVVDRARVVAHLSEPCPIRLWDDASAITDWLTAEMTGGLLDALESIIMQGDGMGETWVGALNQPGTTAVPWQGDLTATLRTAVTAAQVMGDIPTAWVCNPLDAAVFDLERADVPGLWLNHSGYETNTGFGDASNVLGAVPTRVVSNSVPAGTAVLADWNQLKLWVREDTRIDIDVSGPLFERNEFVLRAELRAVSALVRPSSMYLVDISAAKRGNLPFIIGDSRLGVPNADEKPTAAK